MMRRRMTSWAWGAVSMGFSAAIMLPAAKAADLVPAPAGAATCSGCHSRQDGRIPSLRGYTAAAIIEAMRGFNSGARPATLMNRIAKGFTEEETAAIAQWIAGNNENAR